MELEGFLKRVALVELNVEVTGHQVVRQSGVQHSGEQVAVALRVEGHEHRLACCREDQLVVAGHPPLLQGLSGPQPLTVKSHYLAVVHIDPQLTDAVCTGTRTGQHRHSGEKEERVNLRSQAVLKLIEDPLFLEVPEEDIAFGVGRGEP